MRETVSLALRRHLVFCILAGEDKDTHTVLELQTEEIT